MRVWFAPEDLKGGEKLHEQLFRAIQVEDYMAEAGEIVGHMGVTY